MITREVWQLFYDFDFWKTEIYMLWKWQCLTWAIPLLFLLRHLYFCLNQTVPLLFLLIYPYLILSFLNRHYINFIELFLLCVLCVLPYSQTSVTWFSNICSCDSFHISSSTAAWYSAVFRGSSGLIGLTGALGDLTGEPMTGYWRKRVHINYSKYLAISPLIILFNLIVKFMIKS